MRVAFRADASIRIGNGHIMRNLTLATALRLRGIDTHFICRELPGHLNDLIRLQGHTVHEIPGIEAPQASPSIEAAAKVDEKYQDWFGTTQLYDAHACRPILNALQPEWLIVDHYGLAELWEKAVMDDCGSIMVLDDLANRHHFCHLLLDQTFERPPSDYFGKVPSDCTILCGSSFALLRPEFAKLRQTSLLRRKSPQLKKLLVSMGGTDEHNITAEVMKGLCLSGLAEDCHVTIVMGNNAPWLEQVKVLALSMPYSVEVCVGVSNMALLMCDSDVTIGAVGTTAWERCALGLPAGVIILAENQNFAAKILGQIGAVHILEHHPSIQETTAIFINSLVKNPRKLRDLSRIASVVTDGQGCERVIAHLISGCAPWQ